MAKLKVHYKIGNKEFVRVENIYLSVLLSHCRIDLISELFDVIETGKGYE